MSANPDRTDNASSENEERRAQIRWLRSMGDHDSLAQIMDADRHLTQGLEAAEALAELGDVRGLDHLIATLNSPSSYLRHESAQILKRLNHPRGLRALKDHHDESGDLASPHIAASTRLARREQLYGELNQRNTDDLVALWHESDRSKWSDLALEVMGQILKERLGRLPPRNQPGAGRGLEEVDEGADPQVKSLWANGDRESLTLMMEDEPDIALRLEAAEALADLGDEPALDLLIEALDERDGDIREMAAEILDWLDLPRGNEALRNRGIEFETDADNLLAGTAAEAKSTGASVRRDSWVADAHNAPAVRIPRTSAVPPATAQNVWQEQASSAVAPLGLFLMGAAGGLLGYIVFRLALEFLGFPALPSDAGSWLRAPSVYYLIASLLAGAIFGAVGGRVAQSIGRRLGREQGEGDLLPVLGALFEGATTALIVNTALYTLWGV